MLDSVSQVNKWPTKGTNIDIVLLSTMLVCCNWLLVWSSRREVVLLCLATGMESGGDTVWFVGLGLLFSLRFRHDLRGGLWWASVGFSWNEWFLSLAMTIFWVWCI